MFVILDNGHGGMLNNTYQTSGKRSPFLDGKPLFEGVFNRGVVAKIARLLDFADIDHEILVPEERDISLSERVKRVNDLYKKRPDAILISVHANGHQYKYIDKDCKIIYDQRIHGVISRNKLYSTRGLEWTTANGSETFIARTASKKSVEIAEIIQSNYVRLIPEIRNRGVKRAGFAMVKRTHCPAVLIECGFMTNKNECQFLRSNEYRIARAIFTGIESIV